MSDEVHNNKTLPRRQTGITNPPSKNEMSAGSPLHPPPLKKSTPSLTSSWVKRSRGGLYTIPHELIIMDNLIIPTPITPNIAFLRSSSHNSPHKLHHSLCQLHCSPRKTYSSLYNRLRRVRDSLRSLNRLCSGLRNLDRLCSGLHNLDRLCD